MSNGHTALTVEPTQHGRISARTFFTLNGKRGEVTTRYTYREITKVEVYRESEDQPGLMMFLGYYEDLVHTHPRIAHAVSRVIRVHERRPALS